MVGTSRAVSTLPFGVLDLPTTIQDRSGNPSRSQVNPSGPTCVIWVSGARAEGQELDETAIREFLATDYPRLVAAIGLMSGNRAAAEDAVQDALARAWERSERGERIESLPAWVTTVAMNLVRSGLRRVRAERRARGRASPTHSFPSASSVEAGVDIGRALDALPRRQREATVLRYYLDMDLAEIARTLKVSEGSVKTTLYRARQALAIRLGEPIPSEVEDRG
jgi:RNA polymerase sigma-70 factor (ECF subfamily)